MRQTPWPAAVYAADGSSETADIGWQEAVARLMRERTLAVTSVALLKKYADAAGIDRGSLAYADAKAEYDGIIAGLCVALARRDQPSSLPDLELRLRHGFEKRASFSAGVQSLLPAPGIGQRGVIGDIVSGAIGPLIDGLKSIWLRVRDDNALMRKTIETQVRAATWPPFASIAASP